MRILPVLLLSLLALPAAAAEMLATQGKDTLRLTQQACPAEVAQHLPEEVRRHFRRAVAVLDGVEWVGCHAMRTDGTVLVIYADGTMGMVPTRMFALVPDA